ncbi:MAG: 5-oxoprolinase subunit PxpB [Algoriphagus sp.]|uniref:5-oxoprolinase subunit PxpB n=1 Tax=Algoriphagus sp. TaxID=1872435 RepID=UPI0017D0F60C|nr:5-oxoprolinase subunit PxpB [Algoriphagus sp.]NVJ85660.1 5-oxoprolinase subunit PxpB [Algoriphagus sp.]
MVDIIPEIKKITPTWWEFKWKEEPSKSLLQKRVLIKNWLVAHYQDELAEIRQGYQCISVIWKNPPGKDFEVIFPTNLPSQRVDEKTWQIPVCYGGEFGKDLDRICEIKGISPTELIELHSNPIYRLEFYGFLPGFMYLSGLQNSLKTPRKEFPDRTVKAGSVGIGGNQTGIYPFESPGGWHLIGRTPITVFSPEENPPANPQIGDRIQFVPISKEEFEFILQNSPKLKPL